MKKLPKGFRSLDLPPEFKGTLSLESLKDYFNKIINDRPKQEIVFGQYCSTQGFITRSTHNLMLCSDPNCGSCSAMNNALKEVTSKWRT